MQTLNMNGQTFKSLFINGHQSLVNDVDRINELNVFPVPDGDTGTNMKMTMDGGANAIRHSHEESIGVIAKELARGMVFSARGNSGVILSQFFKGLSIGLEEYSTVTPKEFALAMVHGVNQAYKVVNNPTEGTILTVMREASQTAYESVCESFEDYFKVYLTEANLSLARTPDLLPVLKKAGVVDSGAAGFIQIIIGMALAIGGEMLEIVETVTTTPTVNPNGFNADSELEFGYCTEFIMTLGPDTVKKQFNKKKFINTLSTKGNSMVVVQDEDIVKVHIHTLIPGYVLTYAQNFGEFVTLKIENMQEQHNNIISEEAAPAKKEEVKRVHEHKDTAVISVAAGDGVKDLFFELRCDEVVSGGQTMNPSAEDIVAAIREVNADNVIILPNNSNIVMTAQQAAIILEDEINVVVIPSKTIPQGLSACIMYNPEADIETNIEEMNEAIANVKTGQVTFAIKDTNIDGVDIKANDYMALVEKKITACIPDKVEACKRALRELITEDDEIVTLIAGEDVVQEELDEIVSFLEREYDVEVEAHEGLQPVYSFIIGVE